MALGYGFASFRSHEGSPRDPKVGIDDFITENGADRADRRGAPGP